MNFTAPDNSTLGIRQFQFESPEPRDIKGLKAAYPEGMYTFTGATTSGDKFYSKSRLNHTLPATTAFLQPKADARGMSTKDLKIRWSPVKNLAAYIIEIEHSELNLKLKATLPGSATTFNVPNGFLLPDTEYQIIIGTVTKEGNASFVETSFTTSRKLEYAMPQPLFHHR